VKRCVYEEGVVLLLVIVVGVCVCVVWMKKREHSSAKGYARGRYVSALCV